MQRRLWFLPLLLTGVLVGCGGGGGGSTTPPQIASFTANPPTIAASGQAVTLSWSISGSVTSLSISADNGTSPGSVSGSNVTVYR